jgi:hypothetical protein
MLIRKAPETSDFDPGTHRVNLVKVEEVEHDFNNGKGTQLRAVWTFVDPDDPNRTVRGFTGVRLTANSRLGQFVCALAGVSFDRLPDALDVEKLVGRTVIASVEVNAEGRSKIAALVPDVTPKTAPTPQTRSAKPKPVEDFGVSADGDSEDDLPF